MALPTPVPGAGRKRRFGATGTFREYIWLPEAEIAPTRADAGGHPKRDQEASRTNVDRPLAVVDAVNTASPVTSYVHVDHLQRPIRMTSAAKATVWDAVWLPFSAPAAGSPEGSRRRN